MYLIAFNLQHFMIFETDSIKEFVALALEAAAPQSVPFIIIANGSN